MRIARVRVNGKTSTAIIKGRTAHLVSGNIFGALTPTGETAPLSKVELLVPVQPTKIIAIGINYKSHAGDRPAPSIPQAFLKGPNTLVAHGKPIILTGINLGYRHDFAQALIGTYYTLDTAWIGINQLIWRLTASMRFAWERRDFAGNLIRDAAEFVTEESRDAVGKAELAAFNDDVDELRDRAERLLSRFGRIA